MPRRRRRSNTGQALAVSLGLHAAVLLVMAAFSGQPPRPKEKVIAVDIVSPPPNVAGEKMAEPPATQEPAPAAAEPEPEPEPPQPEPQPPAPEPEPPKEPAKAPEPRRTPERTPERPPQRPATQPQANRPRTQPATRPEGRTGTGTQRTQGEGTRTGPATGTNPRPSSPGGEGLNIHVEGDPCPVAGYCENVTRQVQRFFRPPAGNAGAVGEVCFRIQRDGRVTDIEARRVRGGGAPFRLAMMEAAEAAGARGAFGALPGAFDPARWRWCVELSPS